MATQIKKPKDEKINDKHMSALRKNIQQSNNETNVLLFVVSAAVMIATNAKKHAKVNIDECLSIVLFTFTFFLLFLCIWLLTAFPSNRKSHTHKHMNGARAKHNCRAFDNRTFKCLTIMQAESETESERKCWNSHWLIKENTGLFVAILSKLITSWLIQRYVDCVCILFFSLFAKRCKMIKIIFTTMRNKHDNTCNSPFVSANMQKY